MDEMEGCKRWMPGTDGWIDKWDRWAGMNDRMDGCTEGTDGMDGWMDE